MYYFLKHIMLNVYLKPTNYCNVDCSHCYLSKEVRADKNKMSPSDLERTFLFLKDTMKKLNVNRLSIIWHGGEPLILPASYYKEAGLILDKIFPEGNFMESVQTSLIPYNKSFAPLIQERWGNLIGTSIDFDSRLVKGSVEEYHKLWLSKVNLAREDGITVIPGMVPSIKDCQNTAFIYKWFKDNEFWWWNFDRYSNFNKVLENVPTNREHSNFLIGIFNEVVKELRSTGQAAFIKPVVAGISGVIANMPGDRWGTTCQSNFIVINPDGSLNTCPDRSSYEKSFGNVVSGANSFIDSPMRKKWIRIQQAGHRIDDCYNCENSSWCKSGCPITGNACTINGERDDCSGFKTYINHVRDFISQSEENKSMLIDYISQKCTPEIFVNKNYDMSVPN